MRLGDTSLSSPCRIAIPVLGKLIGPFSFAGRLFGVSEARLVAAREPETIELLVEKATTYLTG